MILSGKKHNSDGKLFSSTRSLIRLFLNKQNKNENTECHGTFIPFKSHLNSKQESLIFLLFRSWHLVRSSHPEVLCRKGVPRNFAKFTGNTCTRFSFFNKVAGLRPKACKFIKKRLWHRYFHVNFAKFLRTPLVAASV